MLVQRKAGHGGHGHCLVSTAGPSWAQGALGRELRAQWAPVGVLLEEEGFSNRPSSPAMWLFQVVAETGETLSFHRSHGKNCCLGMPEVPEARDVGGFEAPPGTWDPGFLDAGLSLALPRGRGRCLSNNPRAFPPPVLPFGSPMVWVVSDTLPFSYLLITPPFKDCVNQAGHAFSGFYCPFCKTVK